MRTELARATTDFAHYFRSLVAALGERPSWYGVFAEREPGAARAYQSGAEVPPWDVVQALLHDLAAGRRTAPDPAESARAQSLHRAAVAATDAAPGAVHALRARFDAITGVRDLAIRREREAAHAVDQAAAGADPGTSARLANALAWARDDRERAAARLAELGARLTAVERGEEFWARTGGGAAPLDQPTGPADTFTAPSAATPDAPRRTPRAPSWRTTPTDDPTPPPQHLPGDRHAPDGSPSRFAATAGADTEVRNAEQWSGYGGVVADGRSGRDAGRSGFAATAGADPEVGDVEQWSGYGGVGADGRSGRDAGWSGFEAAGGVGRETAGGVWSAAGVDARGGAHSGGGDPAGPAPGTGRRRLPGGAGLGVPPGVPASRRARFAPDAPEPSVPSVPAPRGARFAGAPATPAAAPDLIPSADGPAKPRGARFAGAPTAPAGQTATPVVPAAPARRAALRGARFAGVAEPAPAPPPRVADPRWAAEAEVGAARLGALRKAGETGAAYLVLCEAAEGPAERLPYLARELERTGLAADVATLLWEVAALPPVALAAAATALAADGRAEDCGNLLRQAAARPAADIAGVAAVLHGNARTAETGDLLETLTRTRTPEDAVEVARTTPELTAELLAAADRVSRSRRRDIVAALRRAGLPDR
ncbi:hypothetical protein [Streptomyces sp. NBC_01190]|uniref:hypothetical protein n=1 Tax=Streptomyces sp. NBC_01190 TaxID=2903767 RepID=UPI00386889B0|nr:hypothetical protein OG519_27670 [Streptomyces sp. NBC_01190]